MARVASPRSLSEGGAICFVETSGGCQGAAKGNPRHHETARAKEDWAG